MPQPLYVSCLGLACPVGLTPASAAAAMRAGISAFGELHFVDNNGEAITGAVVPGITSDLCGRERLIKLLTGAFDGIDGRFAQDLIRSPLLLCTREPEQPGGSLHHLVAEVESHLGFSFDRAASSHLDYGSAATFKALAQARRLIADGYDACLVAAVDTFIDPRSLNWLSRGRRLKTPVLPDGVIPGEAACVSLVSSKPMAVSHVKVQGLGFATETATALNDHPMLGTGMAAAVKEALEEARIPMHDVDFRLCDISGESYGFEELALAQSRLMLQTRQSQVIWHPASSVGDCGAVSGLLQLAWAEQAFRHGYAPGPTALAHASTATGSRAAALVTS
ncbi:hypothetical protein [Pseudoduganella sp. HUAS MS19]